MEYSKNEKTCEILNGTFGCYRYKVMDEVIYYKDNIYLGLGS